MTMTINRNGIRKVSRNEWDSCFHAPPSKDAEWAGRWTKARMRPGGQRELRQHATCLPIRSGKAGSRIVFVSKESVRPNEPSEDYDFAAFRFRNLTRLRFEAFADQWDRETSVLSSPTRKAAHPAYRAIVKLGRDAIPFILQRMRDRGGHWFWALTEITGDNPIPESAHGQMSEMREAWLKWGQERGHC